MPSLASPAVRLRSASAIRHNHDDWSVGFCPSHVTTAKRRRRWYRQQRDVLLALSLLGCTRTPITRRKVGALPDRSCATLASGLSPRACGVTVRSSPLPPHTFSVPASAYTGTDSKGIPRYATLRVSPEDSVILRRVYGIEDPRRLYVSDSTPQGLLKYDTQTKRCRACYVNSYRVGYVSVRKPGESWEQAERRVHSTRAEIRAGHPRAASHSIADLDPRVVPLVAAMLSAARTAGFTVRVTTTYRSPLREALLMAEGHGSTHTLTSNHSYGRAVDISVDDGIRSHASTRRDWVAFRRWVTRYPTPPTESFYIIGAPDSTWDWAHIGIPSARIGFRSIPDALARARACITPSSTTVCDFQPELSPSVNINR